MTDVVKGYYSQGRHACYLGIPNGGGKIVYMSFSSFSQVLDYLSGRGSVELGQPGALVHGVEFASVGDQANVLQMLYDSVVRRGSHCFNSIGEEE